MVHMVTSSSTEQITASSAKASRFMLVLSFSRSFRTTFSLQSSSLFTLKQALSPLFPDSILAKEIHCFVLPHGYESDLFVVNALVPFYARSNDLGSARIMFDRMSGRDIVSWNSMIAGYSQSGLYEDCLRLYREMVGLAGFRPNGLTVVSVLQACAQMKDLVFGMEVHCFVIDSKIEMDASVCNSIIGLYAKCGSLDYSRELFEEMTERDEITNGSMISGYMVHGFVEKAMDLFREMKNPGLRTWNSVPSGLVQNNRHEGIPGLLQEMQISGFKPNSVTLSSVLPTFSYFSNLKVGEEIHGYAIRNSCNQNIYVATAKIDTYAKSGFLRFAHRIFVQSRSKSVIIWTAIISAYATHGDANAAISLFAEMLASGTRPDPVTLTAVLAACAHAGVVDEALMIFDAMLPNYGIQPTIEHYACMPKLEAYLRRASFSLTELVQFHRELKSGRSERKQRQIRLEDVDNGNPMDAEENPREDGGNLDDEGRSIGRKKKREINDNRAEERESRGGVGIEEKGKERKKRKNSEVGRWRICVVMPNSSDKALLMIEEKREVVDCYWYREPDPHMGLNMGVVIGITPDYGWAQEFVCRLLRKLNQWKELVMLLSKNLLLGGEVCMWGETADASDIQQTIWPCAAAAAETDLADSLPDLRMTLVLDNLDTCSSKAKLINSILPYLSP
ncbi:hypothetical protein HHK36_004501 [Tetracentron sinense]|uniref:beta-N-acetylhexosaminidase n=1 Tax=Tetracentron sinense TaxID=13715 RepID=A0A835DPJ1_TETSI|nr:hypothetical protein HHK36_004501 [Tetracentron sinense]